MVIFLFRYRQSVPLSTCKQWITLLQFQEPGRLFHHRSNGDPLASQKSAVLVDAYRKTGIARKTGDIPTLISILQNLSQIDISRGTTPASTDNKDRNGCFSRACKEGLFSAGSS